MFHGLDDLLSYVPRCVARRLADDPRLPGDLEVTPFRGAVVFADVSGFTTLARHLDEVSQEGAEELTGLLNRYYGELVEMVERHGGDVIRYAGDALLAVWPAAADGSPEETLRLAVLRAAACGLEVQRRLTNYEVTPGIGLSLRYGVSAGELEAALLGGSARHWQLAVVGPALEPLRLADQAGALGEVTLAAEALAAAGEQIAFDPRPFGCGRVRELRESPEPEPLSRRELTSEGAESLEAFLPPVVLSRLRAGQGDWMAELRHVTVIFVRVNGLDAGGASPRRLHEAFGALSASAERYEGSLLQLMVDDKGCVGIVCSGLPPRTHEDDALRGVRIAEEIVDRLAARGLTCGIGIARGRVFCGPLGSAARREYTVMGTSVNRAARLMQAARRNILCDAECATAVRETEVAWRSLPPYRLKGFDEPIEVFRPDRRGAREAGEPAVGGRLFGRARERNALRDLLAAVRGGRGGVLLLEGEAGIGKSHLAAELLRRAPEYGVRTLVGRASAIERAAPYFAWREVFCQSLGLEESSSSAARREKVEAVLHGQPDLLRFASLLNPFLGVDFPENETARQLAGRALAENFQELLCALLRPALEEAPHLVVLEDVHWLDSASWELARRLREVFPRLGLVLATRPIRSELPPDARALLEEPAAIWLMLDTLAREDTLLLACDRLGVESLDPPLAAYLWEQTQGNPFFAEELAGYLLGAGLIEVRAGVCRLRDNVSTEVRQAIPGSVRDLIASRIDQLPPAQQLTVKVASVIGRSFLYPTLQAIYPVDSDRPALPRFLTFLNEQGFTVVEAEFPELQYVFKHIVIQQVAYGQIPIAQRRRLHALVARWYEDSRGPTPADFPLLAWHYGKAREYDREIDYLTRAGDDAQRNGVFREAREFYREALARDEEVHGPPDDPARRLRRAHWERQLGESLVRLGNLVEGKKQLARSVRLLGYPLPEAPLATDGDTCVQVLRQLWHRIRPARADAATAALHEEGSLSRPHEAALAYQKLAEVHYFDNDIRYGMNRALRALNTFEKASPSPGRAASYAGMCVVSGLLGFKRLAENYARLGEDLARRVGHRPSLAYVLIAVSMFRLGMGQWERVRRGARECIAIDEDFGDRRQLCESVTIEAMLDCFLAEFPAGGASYERVRREALRSGNVLHEAWSWSGEGEVLFRLGELEPALRALTRAAELLRGSTNHTEEVRVLGIGALLRWRLGRREEALRSAREALELLARFTCTTPSTLEGFAGSAETFLLAWESGDAAQAAAAREACRHLRRYTRIFPIGAPRTERLLGLAAQLSGRPSRAARHWERSVTAARRLGLDFEFALTLADAARHGLPAEEPWPTRLQEAQAWIARRPFPPLFPPPEP